MAKKIDIPKDNNIIEIPLEDAMPENYLPYAVEVAKDRALPDVRDGLKPVHRRILYGAYMLKAFPDKPYFKSARIVGDILGKFHPHGDTSVYDALVILAQDFSTRYTLIDGHGNWGSVDGDSAAAMRYTEARLTNIALEMLKDIDKNVVDMVDNYSETEKEPVVLPSRYPNLLVNGAFGIAVGLSTNIPPHNLGEVIDGTIAYIDNNDIEIKELMEYIKGPDLPTGGILIGENSMLSCYETGEGKVSLRAKTKIEELENGRLGIIINEFPYRKNKSKILQTISEMTADKKHSKTLESISDIRDESDRNGIRAVIEFKKSIDKTTAQKVLKYLLKKTDLQCNLNFNMVALNNGKPQTMNLKTIIKYYVEHQKDVVLRRTKNDLENAKKRFHIVEGFIKAINIMDDIIKTIRQSKSKKDSENNLVEKFSFTQIQAQAIVELMLYRLTGLEIKVFEKEYKELSKKIKSLEKIIDDEKELLKVIKKELIYIKDQYADERRTKIINDDNEAKIEIEEIIIEEDNIITLSNEGFIKRISVKSYTRTNLGVEDIDYREGDFNRYFIESNTKDNLIVFTNKGNAYQIKVIDIPELKWKEKGEKLDSIIKNFDLENEKIINVKSVRDFNEEKEFIFITDNGIIKKSGLYRFKTVYSKIQALKLKKDEELVYADLISTDLNYFMVSTQKGYEFCIKKPYIEETDRNIRGIQFIDLVYEDKINLIKSTNEYTFKDLYVNVDKTGSITVNLDKKNKKIDYENIVLIFDDKGFTYKIPSYILEGIYNLNQKINLNDLFNDFSKKSKVLNFYVISKNQNGDVYLFNSNGYAKKMLLTEVTNTPNELSSVISYKFKDGDESLINAELVNLNQKIEAILITKRAMCIRFNANSINYNGKNASGVTGISLKDDDKVKFVKLIGDNLNFNNQNDCKILKITTNKNNAKEINIDDIKIQNRAGRGKNIMQLSIDEFLKNIR